MMSFKIFNSDIMPLNISNNRRYFLDRKGKPFFLLGDTQWELYRKFKPQDVRTILKDRKKKGFNTVLVMLPGIDPSKPNINGDFIWMNNNPEEPNEAYFKHVDRIIEITCELDFIQIVGVYHKNYNNLFTLLKAKKWAEFVAKRYRNVKHIIWSMYPEAKKEYIPVVRQLADALKKNDRKDRMISVHPDPSPYSSSFIHTEEWLSFNMIQSSCFLEQLYPMVIADYSLTPLKPVIMAEGAYEDSEVGKEIMNSYWIRKQAYWSYFGGAYHVYGHKDNYINPENYKKWINSKGSSHVGIFKKIITSIDKWWEYVPDQSIFLEGAGADRNLNTAIRSIDSTRALLYLSSNCKVKLLPGRVICSGKVKLTWINPQNAKRLNAGVKSISKPIEVSTPGNWQDALLLISGI